MQGFIVHQSISCEAAKWGSGPTEESNLYSPFFQYFLWNSSHLFLLRLLKSWKWNTEKEGWLFGCWTFHNSCPREAINGGKGLQVNEKKITVCVFHIYFWSSFILYSPQKGQKTIKAYWDLFRNLKYSSTPFPIGTSNVGGLIHSAMGLFLAVKMFTFVLLAVHYGRAKGRNIN